MQYALAHFTSMKMLLFPCLRPELSHRHIEESTIPDVGFNDRIGLQLVCRLNSNLLLKFPDRSEPLMIGTVGKYCTGIDDNLCTATNGFIHSEFAVHFTVVWH